MDINLILCTPFSYSNIYLFEKSFVFSAEILQIGIAYFQQYSIPVN